MTRRFGPNRPTPLLALVIALAAVISACGVPTDETAQVIPENELPEPLRQAPTTTTTTPLPAATRVVDYFLLMQPEEVEQRKVESVPLTIPDTTDLTTLIAPLFTEEVRTADATGQLINVVPQYGLELVGPIEPTDGDDGPIGVATVFLTADEDNPPVDRALKDATAQLVFTLTQFRGVDAILIEINGEPQGLPTSEESTTTEPVTVEDYRFYDPAFVPPTSTSTTTTAPPRSSTTIASDE